jgi:hypothetical protein
MRTDELRAELRMLADEIVPFEPDVLALRRRNRRGTWLRAAAVVAVVVAVGAVVFSNRAQDRTRVESARKELDLKALRHVDALVVPANEDTRHALEHSSVVDRYAHVSAMNAALSDLGPGLAGPQSLRKTAGALLSSDTGGYAVELTTRGASGIDALRGAVPDAQVFDVAWRGGDVDAELFMKPDASTQEVDAVRQALLRDKAEVASFTFLDHNAAYDEFKRIFADQRALVESVAPSALPESFRLVLTRGTRPDDVRARFQGMAGYDTFVAAEPAQLFVPASTP